MIGRAFQSPARRSRRGRPTRWVALALSAALLVAGCSEGGGSSGPTPADFTSIAASFSSQGILISHVVSGEAGCPDRTLTPTAIAFDAKGADQTTPVRVHLYIFRDGSVYTRLRSSVDTCARSYVTDPASYATVDLSPYVAAGLGPWGPQFKNRLRTALEQATPPDNTGV